MSHSYNITNLLYFFVVYNMHIIHKFYTHSSETTVVKTHRPMGSGLDLLYLIYIKKKRCI